MTDSNIKEIKQEIDESRCEEDPFSIDIVKHEIADIVIKTEPDINEYVSVNTDDNIIKKESTDSSNSFTSSCIQINKETGLNNEDDDNKSKFQFETVFLPTIDSNVNDININNLKQESTREINLEASNSTKCSDNEDEAQIIKVDGKRRPHACDTCTKTFTSLNYLKKHKLIHTGKQPYSCKTCKKKFTIARDLDRHEKIHTKNRPHSCDICNKTFMFSSNLIAHKKKHSGVPPYTCDICNMSFTASWTLVVHLRKHNGERPYSCDLCDMAFTTSGTLVVHKRVHTKERPYKCIICNKSFATSWTLLKHKETHWIKTP